MNFILSGELGECFLVLICKTKVGGALIYIKTMSTLIEHGQTMKNMNARPSSGRPEIKPVALF